MNGETHSSTNTLPIDRGGPTAMTNRNGPMPNSSATQPRAAAPSQERHRTNLLQHPPFDPWRAVEALRMCWLWLLIGGGGLGLLALLLGLAVSNTWNSVSIQLIHNEGPNAFQTSEFGETFRPQPLSEQAFRSLLRSQELLHRVSMKCRPPLTTKMLSNRLRLSPDRNVDFVTVSLSANNAQNAVSLANLFALEAAQLTREMQATEAKSITDYLRERLQENDRDQAAANQQLLSFSRELPHAEVSDADIRQELQPARRELVSLLAQYTDAHPRVQEQRAKITALERQLSDAGGYAKIAANPATSVLSPTGKTNTVAAAAHGSNRTAKKADELDTLLKRAETRIEALEKGRSMLQSRLREAQLFAADPPGYYRVFAPASENDVVRSGRRLKIALLALFGAFVGTLCAALAVLFVEISDRRVKTADDVQRVTGLPMLAALGDLDRMSTAAQDGWAFRTWTILQGKLNHSPDGGIVCGFTSSERGEGRSTWVRLLGRAASQRGMRVLTIATRPTAVNGDGAPEVAVNSGPGFRDTPPQAPASNEACPDDTFRAMTEAQRGALTHSVLSHPEQIAEQLIAPNAPPVVHIPLPGWVWDYEHRKQWQAALQHWRKIENVVILVELPPASIPEAVLLAEHVPQLVWLSGGEADPTTTREQLETLRHARCNLVGAVLNRESVPVVKKNVLQWITAMALLLSVDRLDAQTADPDAPESTQAVASAEAKSSFPAATPHKRAHWQERLTVGPGDVLNFSLFGRPELTRSAVAVGPDGRVSYLQAQDVPAANLTIDELRTKMDEALSAYYRAPRTIITPVAFSSKKYFLLGSVVQKGVFTLDRSVTIIEAIARARGLETGLQQRNLTEIADLQHAFLVRHSERVPVDFEKLFLRGDLSQNVPLEPDDYLYFPPADLKEVYVVGEVRTPGPAPYTPNSSALAAIVSQGGFTDRAWKKRVLVVRGSLNHPEIFMVDANAVLSARTTDFKLEPHDIVYVHYRPWIKAEEILDLAATSFIQAAVITWTGGHVGPLIQSPLIK